jgi:hypothetical protein
MDAIDYPKPPVRRLRVCAFDPHASTKLDTVGFNMATIELPWEDDVLPGPVNEYLEVIDIDPVSGQFYEPVDLNNAYLLAQDGLPPSEGNPRFHQQMVFAVAMTTIRAFERALGRKVFWSSRWSQEKGTYEEVPKLRPWLGNSALSQQAYVVKRAKWRPESAIFSGSWSAAGGIRDVCARTRAESGPCD